MSIEFSFITESKNNTGYTLKQGIQGTILHNNTG